MKIGVIGCGNMGGGMVRQLVAAGLDPSCYDPDAEIQSRMRSFGAHVAKSAGTLVAGREIIILSLPKAEVVEAVMAEASPHIEAGAIVLDTSTSTPATSQRWPCWAKRSGLTSLTVP